MCAGWVVVWGVVLCVAGTSARPAEDAEARREGAGLQAPGPPRAGLRSIEAYISQGWDSLTRRIDSCEVVVDPKMPRGASVLYVPFDFSVPAAVDELRMRCGIQVDKLPKVIRGPGEIDPASLDAPGLLYLENPYVVPGGRFNEMYGWDSYFIVRGLLGDGRVKLAREMVENFFFEIEHYGTVLNANRAYYLTRSQPPFLSSMVLAVYDAERAEGEKSATGKDDHEWLRKGYEYAARDYEMWTHAPHLAGATGLSRYFDFGEGPAPESVNGEPGYYRQVAEYFAQHKELAAEFVARDGSAGATEGATKEGAAGAAAQNAKDKETFAVPGCEAKAASADTSGRSASTSSTVTPDAARGANADAGAGVAKGAGAHGCAGMKLSAEYFKGDRAMRESGFDVSFRFGAYGANAHHFAPVCLNSLLYKTEKDLQRMSELLGDEAAAAQWRERGEKRKAAMERYLWNADAGMFFDYDFMAAKRSSYAYATTFYPLWAGLATVEQARGVAGNVRRFERPGGVVTSVNESGAQWDFPYGWAPIQLLADEGLWRYGYNEDADRLSYEFLSTVLENFDRDGTIREKYNMVTRSSETNVKAGYHANVIGFGWTNGAFLVLGREMSQAQRDRLGTVH